MRAGHPATRREHRVQTGQPACATYLSRATGDHAVGSAAAGGSASSLIEPAPSRGVAVEPIAPRAAVFGVRGTIDGKLRRASLTARKELTSWRLTRSVAISSLTSPAPQRYFTVASVSGTHATCRRKTPNGSDAGVPCTLPSTRYGPTSTSTWAVRVWSRRATSPRGTSAPHPDGPRRGRGRAVPG